MVANHLSRLNPELITLECNKPIIETFPDENLFALWKTPWYANIANYLAHVVIRPNLSSQEKKRFMFFCRHYFWDKPYLSKLGQDQVIKRCVLEEEQQSILTFCCELNCGGHFSGKNTTLKVMQSGFYWPILFKDAYNFCKTCDCCQRTGTIGKRNEMPLTGNLVVELFDVWGIDFMGPFVPFCGFEYILIAIDYVSK